jgi:NAD(P)-dependent dehydrogenase (short-subunit alcohol dehydrogenase family)
LSRGVAGTDQQPPSLPITARTRSLAGLFYPIRHRCASAIDQAPRRTDFRFMVAALAALLAKKWCYSAQYEPFRAVEMVSLRRWVRPAAIADVILFPASGAARAIHGAASPAYGLS